MGIVRYRRLRKYKIFVCFHKDTSLIIAESVKKCLESYNLRAFVSERDLTVGDDWDGSIEYVIDRCMIFAPILTLGALRSKPVRKEIDRASKACRLFIPLKDQDVTWKQAEKALRIPIDKDQGIEFKDEHELYRKIESQIKNFRKLCSERYREENLKDLIEAIKRDFSLLQRSVNIRLAPEQGKPAELTTWMDRKQAETVHNAIEKGKRVSVPIKGIAISQSGKAKALHTGSSWRLDVGEPKFEPIPVRFSVSRNGPKYDTKCKITRYGKEVLILRTVDDSALDFRFEFDLRQRRSSEMRLQINFVGLSASEAVNLYRLREKIRIGRALTIFDLRNKQVISRGKTTGIRWDGPDDYWYKLVSALALIEKRTATQFSIPKGFTRKDAENILFVSRIIKTGKTKTGTKQVSIKVSKSEALRLCDDSRKKRTSELSLTGPTDQMMQILGKTVNLGPAKFVCPRARLAGAIDQVRDAIVGLKDDAYYRLVFEPLPRGGHNTVIEYRKWIKQK